MLQDRNWGQINGTGLFTNAEKRPVPFICPGVGGAGAVVVQLVLVVVVEAVGGAGGHAEVQAARQRAAHADRGIVGAVVDQGGGVGAGGRAGRPAPITQGADEESQEVDLVVAW